MTGRWRSSSRLLHDPQIRVARHADIGNQHVERRPWRISTASSASWRTGNRNPRAAAAGRWTSRKVSSSSTDQNRSNSHPCHSVSVSCCRRQAHAERSPLSDSAFEIDLPPPRFDDALHDREAQAEPLVGSSSAVSAEERLEDSRLSSRECHAPGLDADLHDIVIDGVSPAVFTYHPPWGDALMALTVRLYKICCKLPSGAQTLRSGGTPHLRP